MSYTCAALFFGFSVFDCTFICPGQFFFPDLLQTISTEGFFLSRILLAAAGAKMFLLMLSMMFPPDEGENTYPLRDVISPSPVGVG
jgi:hypothetical protein